MTVNNPASSAIAPQHRAGGDPPVAPRPQRAEDVARLPEEQGQNGKAEDAMQVHRANPLRVGVGQAQVAGEQLGGEQDDEGDVGPGETHRNTAGQNDIAEPSRYNSKISRTGQAKPGSTETRVSVSSSVSVCAGPSLGRVVTVRASGSTSSTRRTP